MANNEDYEWVSVSTMAKRLGCSTQNVYHKIKCGLIPTKEFERGSMKGVLCGTIKQTN